MQHAGPVFFYLCAAIFVPVLLARFVIRADWLTIRNASFLWYGALVLPGAVTVSSELLGWALILAMFMSFWVLPLLSLMLKLWRLLGARGGPAAPGTARRPFSARVPLAVTSLLQCVVVVLLLAGAVAFAF